ncbi:tetratricopeptide repeat-containing serine protease family protein [Scytonema sp. NUACC26]|uniref:tetratricopeptide repeat-containing S1 family peptidase n=1 Tax=Scytonema sp. NUACC26 TaxID=3140176 RepID=UPI0038B2ADD8
MTNSSSGSGVIVEHRGQIYTVLTNHHVVEDGSGSYYSVLTADGRMHSAQWLRSTQFGTLDLALVQFTSHLNYKVVTFGNSNVLAVGDSVYAAGFPSWHFIKEGNTITALEDTRDWGVRAFRLTTGTVRMYAERSLQGGYQLGYTNDVVYALGSVRDEQGDSRGALEAYSQAVRRNPDKSEAFLAYFNQGNIRFQQGDYQGALEDYTAAIQKKPDAAIAYNNRAVTRIKQGDYQGAVLDWTQASQHGTGDASLYYNRGVAYSRIGNRQAAIADYNKALQIDRKYALAYNSRGNILADTGDRVKALEDYNQAIKVNPGFADAYNNRAILRAASGDRTGAIEDLQKAAQLLIDRGKTAQYQQVMENLKRLQR